MWYADSISTNRIIIYYDYHRLFSMTLVANIINANWQTNTCSLLHAGVYASVYNYHYKYIADSHKSELGAATNVIVPLSKD